MKSRVAVIMGSKSDLRVMREAVEILKKFKVKTDVNIVSAHRTPQFMQAFALKAHKKNIRVIIAGAGGAAHLPGMVASLTDLPVVGVPVEVGRLRGLDALLSIVQMPRGVPVATVALDNAFNAGLLAVRILALSDKSLARSLNKFMRAQTKRVLKANRDLRKIRM